MDRELEHKIIAKFPEIYDQYRLAPDQTPFAFGFECGNGWFDILCSLTETISNRYYQNNSQIEQAISWNKKVNDPNYEWKTGWVERKEREVPEKLDLISVSQVKEKFGTLRFYYNGPHDDYIEGAICFAEQMTAKTCEMCGKPGSGSRGGWIRTLCKEHKLELGYVVEEEPDR